MAKHVQQPVWLRQNAFAAADAESCVMFRSRVHRGLEIKSGWDLLVRLVSPTHASSQERMSEQTPL